MAYEIVKFNDDAGQVVAITPRDVRQTFCPSATDQEIQMFLALCANQHLNPWTKDAYLVKYGSGPASIITSRAAIQKRADNNPEFEGTEVGVVVLNAQGVIEHRPGEAHYKQLGEQLLGGWARVYRKGRKPYYSEVPMSEYNTGKNNWAKMPGTMITKVAEMHAIRGQFPQEFQGMYDASEMAQAQEVVPDSVEAPQAPVLEAMPTGPQGTPPVVPPHQPAGPTDAEKARMREVVGIAVSVGVDREEARKYVWNCYRANGMSAVESWARAIEPAPPAPGSAQWAAQAIEATDPGASAVAVGNMVLIADKPEDDAIEPDLYDEPVDF